MLIVKWTVPSSYNTRHLCEHMWPWPGGLTLGVPSGRKAWAGLPYRRRAMSSAACRNTAGTRASGMSLWKKIFAAVASSTQRTGRRASSPRGPRVGAPRPAATSGRSLPWIAGAGVARSCAVCPFCLP